jgi:signal transduction histidine kinase
VDLGRIVSDTATLLENSAELTAAHRVAVDAPGGPVWLNADEGQLRQIVWNLATNGLRAMANGGQLTLAVRAERSGQAADVVLEVRDEGHGIRQEDLDGIFQPFRTGFARGTGLGLSIVQRLVAEYGGEIQITSSPGRGTSVFVHLPAEPRESARTTPTEKVG